MVTIEGRLARVSAGHRIKLADLQALKDELDGVYGKLADLFGELEAAAEDFGDYADELTGDAMPKADRAEYWENLAVTAGEALAALQAIHAWKMP